MTYLISQELLERIIAYLGTRPYVEVAQGIEALKALPPADIKPTVVS